MQTLTSECTVVGCHRRRHAFEMCSLHYKRWKRRGTTHDITPEERFFSHVREEGDCWVWTATRLPAGYGNFAVNRIPVGAHRWAYEFLIAAIPDGLDLDHTCRNPPCVNPWHLEPVTDFVNVVVRGTGITARNARKTHCLRNHEFTAANTYVTKKGQRYCRACIQIRARR